MVGSEEPVNSAEELEELVAAVAGCAALLPSFSDS
jgi:hypothetical protein